MVLNAILKGEQRVPSLLLLNPSQPLTALNLQHYEVVACERVHDLKGHRANLLSELVHIHRDSIGTQVQRVQNAWMSKDKVTAADLRTTLIKSYLMVNGRECSISNSHTLKTLVIITGLMYSTEKQRSPRAILQLYNICWLHFKLCRGTLWSLTICMLFQTILHYSTR